MSNVTGMSTQYDSITDDMCSAMKTAFTDKNDHAKKGGLKKMGDAMKDGMVLVMSIWDDHAANMQWLDGTYPKDSTKAGGPRGTCPEDGGNPDVVEKEHPDAYVKWTNIKIGEFGSTFKGDSPGPGPTPPGPTPSGCPGGSLSACIDLCPSNPPVAFQACVESCTKRCDKETTFDGPEFLESLLDKNGINFIE